MTLQEVKDLLDVAKGISNQIDLEYACYNELFEDFQGLNKGLCNALDSIVDTIDKHLGGNEWASWWVFECNYGDNPMEAGVGEDMLLVDSVEKLYTLATKEMNG